MRAEIISTGTELLLGQIQNSNSRYLAEVLSAGGIEVLYQTTVGDNLERLMEAFRVALARADLVVSTGGLGPTQFDLTREAAARVFGLPLEPNQEVLERIRRFFHLRGQEMPENNIRQTMVPRGAIVLPNCRGTAPGLILRRDQKTAILFPGPPEEMIPMFEKEAARWLVEQGMFRGTIVSRLLRVMGMGESALEIKLAEVLRGEGNPAATLLARNGEVLIRLTAQAENRETALELIRPVEEKIRQQLGSQLYGTDGDRLEAVVGRMLRERGLTLAVAESCTGGLLSSSLTDVPGSSDYFLAGLTCYSNRAKMELLGVKEETLANYGAVSANTALEMAKGVCTRCGADVGLATTGIAGPGGGTERKPVGLVYLAVNLPGFSTWRELRIPGDREIVKTRTVKAGLDLLRNALLQYQ